MPEQQVRIVVDSREANSGIPKLLAKIPGVTLESAMLDAGDYLPAPGFIVERKTGHDFAASIVDGRFIGQAKLMCAAFARVVILIEGNIYETRSNMTRDALHGAMSWLTALEGASVIYSRDQQDSAELIHTFARHLQHGLGYEIPLRSGKPKDLKVFQQFLVEGLPGVGPGKARALIQHFGSARAVFAASLEELAKAPGMGAKTAQKIVEVMEARWE